MSVDRFAGRVALVTGAGSPAGIGFATAQILGRAGARLAMVRAALDWGGRLDVLVNCAGV